MTFTRIWPNFFFATSWLGATHGLALHRSERELKRFPLVPESVMAFQKIQAHAIAPYCYFFHEFLLSSSVLQADLNAARLNFNSYFLLTVLWL